MTLDFLRPFLVRTKIRAGRPKDGGYVLENDSLSHVEVIYSYGVGWEISFEKAIFRLTKKNCRLFDPTMLDVSTFMSSWNKGLYHFTKYCAKAILWKPFLLTQKLNGYGITFYNEGLATAKTPKYDSFPGHMKRFGDQNKQVFLKIDIEGGEYEVFRDPKFLASLENVVQMVIEFHDVEQHFTELKTIIETIRPNLSLVHVHGNNWEETFKVSGKDVPNAIELTFLKTSLLPAKVFDETPYPIPGIDYPNKISKADIEMSQFTRDF